MRSYADTTHYSPIGPSWHKMEERPVQAIRCHRGRFPRVDLMRSLPRLREIKPDGRHLLQAFEGMQIRIISIRKNIERGEYSIKAKQVAEKITKDVPCDLLHLWTNH
jgi:Anti-sigma-28 factor, FlgM